MNPRGPARTCAVEGAVRRCPRGLNCACVASLFALAVANRANAAVPDLEPQREHPLDATDEGGRFTLLEENDGSAVTPYDHHTDQFYTQGGRISMEWTPAPERALAQAIAEPFGGARLSQRWGWTVGQDLYTPSSTQITSLAQLEKDRPYAGWLYAGLTLDLAWDWVPMGWEWEPGARLQSQLYLEVLGGITGPDAEGGPTQSSVHAFLRAAANCPVAVPGEPYSHLGCPPPPLGWGEYQTANRPGGGISSRYSWEVLGSGIAPGRFTAATGSDLAARVSVDGRATLSSLIGTAGAGVSLKAGLLDSNGSVSPPGTRLTLNAYGRVGGHLVAWNELISGPLLNGVIADVHPRPGVAEITVGLAMRFLGADVIFADLFTTPELSINGGGTPETAWHHVGEIEVSLIF